jgi:DNA-binding transcriptional regulator YiaG
MSLIPWPEAHRMIPSRTRGNAFGESSSSAQNCIQTIAEEEVSWGTVQIVHFYRSTALFDFGISTPSPVNTAFVGVEAAPEDQTYIREYKLFLKRLKQAREEAKLTQVQVAKLLSRPQSFVSKSESGERRVDFVELRHLAKIYRKPLSFFETR